MFAKVSRLAACAALCACTFEGAPVTSVEFDGAPLDDGSVDAAGDVPAVLFASDGGRLFRIEVGAGQPLANAMVTDLGLVTDGQNNPNLDELALDSDGSLIAVDANEVLYRVNAQTAVATKVADLTPINDVRGLTLKPADATARILFGADTGTLYNVGFDGSLAAIGDLGAGLAYSGDITWHEDRLLATIRGGACAPNDCLVTLNPATGTFTDIAPLSAASFFGLASSAGRLFGFRNNSLINEFDPASGETIGVFDGPVSWDMAAP